MGQEIDQDLSVETDIAAIDAHLKDVTGRTIIPSSEVSDILLDVRSKLMKYRVDIPEELTGLQKIG